MLNNLFRQLSRSPTLLPRQKRIHPSTTLTHSRRCVHDVDQPAAATAPDLPRMRGSAVHPRMTYFESSLIITSSCIHRLSNFFRRLAPHTKSGLPQKTEPRDNTLVRNTQLHTRGKVCLRAEGFRDVDVRPGWTWKRPYFLKRCIDKSDTGRAATRGYCCLDTSLASPSSKRMPSRTHRLQAPGNTSP